MAKISFTIVQILRKTANQLEQSNAYQWGHMGSCNCGFLAQQVTNLNKAEIHTRALQRYGDWNEQLNDYCPTSGLLFDDVISELLAAGFDVNDLKHLERLSDPAVLKAAGRSDLRYNFKHDVLLYLRSWATMIEAEILCTLTTPHPQPIEEFELV